MKAIVCNEWCKPEELKVSEIKNPTLDDSSVRVEIHASGVNFPDVLIVQGKYQYKPPFPFSPGSEVAGIISEIGKNVKSLKVGDRIMAVTGHGAFAEEICVPEDKITLVPESMDFITAASMSLTYGTSSYALFQRANIKENDVVLIHGATGGGFSLAITGDIIYSVKSAKFTVAYTNAGLSPDGSSTFFLPRIVGMKRAKELMLTNRIFSAEEALEMNLIDQVLDDQEQLDQAIEKQAEIFMKGPKKAYAGVKKLLNISFDNGLETQMDIEGIKISENAESLDGVEGLKAFSEKRKPNFNE